MTFSGKYTASCIICPMCKFKTKYLRRDDSTHQIRLALGQTSVVQTDLIPLLREHSDDSTLLDLLLRLLVNLTSPALLIFNQEIPQDKVAYQIYLQLVAQQQAFKDAFTDGGVWAKVASIIGDGLQQEGTRDDNTNLVIEMCLVLLRNVLAVVPGRQDSIRTQDDADLHDQVLWSLHLAGMPDLLLYLATCQHEQELALHTLEIISLMLRQQDPQNLATSALHRSKEEKKKDDDELLRLRESEKACKHQQIKKHFSARHSRFGGTYRIQNMKSISDRDIISHQPVMDTNTINFDKDKKGKKVPKNRAPLCDTNTTRRSTLAIRLFLQEFCVEFLNGAYNNIMYIVKDNLNRARTQEHDESYYLWSMKFFMEFNRHHEFKVEFVSETLSIQTVHYVQTNIENYYEMMTTEKKKIPLWSRRMHNGLRAYQEILMTLAFMDRSTDASVMNSSMTLKSKIFYVVEYRELPMILLQNYDPVKMSKNYLKDLVEMNHIFLKLLEGMFKKSSHLMVQQSGKRKPTKKKKPVKQTKEQPLSTEKLEEMWSKMADELSSVLETPGELPEVIPFDALSEESEEDQKGNAMRRVNALMRKGEIREGLSLFRASREVWPEGDIFGAQGVEPAEEFSCLREVFMADLNPVEESGVSEEEDEEDELAEEMEEHSSARVSEKELDFVTLVRRFANTKIMQAYGLLLKSYATNAPYTNRCIVKLFHRIAWDSKLPAIFFQSSLLTTFHEAMTDPARKTNSTIGEIVQFAKFIVRQFFKVAETNPKVFMEILFWKNNKEAVDIECGYDNQNNATAVKSLWSEEEEYEVSKLFDEFKSREKDPEDDMDVVDYISENLIRQDRTRRMVIRKLKDIGLIENIREIKKQSVRTKGREWTEVDEEELRVLFDEHKGAIDPLARILDFMVTPRPKNRVVDKLLELGIISDKSEVKKKKIPKPKKSKNDGERFLSANNESDSDGGQVKDLSEGESSEDEETVSSTQKKPPSSQSLPVVSPYLVSAALKKVLCTELKDCVQWLVDTMTEVADDREEDGDFQAVPILAFSSEQSRAIEDADFQTLMKVIGFQTPQSHEEMFWRLPSKLTIEGLRKRAQYLRQGMEGTLPEVSEAQTQKVIQSGLENKPKPTKPKKKEPRPKKNKAAVSDFDTLLSIERGESDKENVSEDSDDEPLMLSNRSSATKRPLPPSAGKGSAEQVSKKRRILLEDSDNEEDNILPVINTEDLELRLEETESFNDSLMKSRLIDSDDDEPVLDVKKSSQNDDSDEEVPVVKSRVRAIVESDEED